MIKIMLKHLTPFLLASFLLFLGASSGTAGTEQPGTSGQPEAEEQNTKAMEVFGKIRRLMENSDRMAVLPQVEAGYREIITNYPLASISQEAHWRLMLVYLTDYTPPAFDRAEELYAAFNRRYPGSNNKGLMDDSLLNSYYIYGKWERIIRFLIPTIKTFIETGKLSRPLDMFMYAEAKRNTGDFTEAEKGYKIVTALFPDSKESALSKERLDEIRKIRAKIN